MTPTTIQHRTDVLLNRPLHHWTHGTVVTVDSRDCLCIPEIMLLALYRTENGQRIYRETTTHHNYLKFHLNQVSVHATA